MRASEPFTTEELRSFSDEELLNAIVRYRTDIAQMRDEGSHAERVEQLSERLAQLEEEANERGLSLPEDE